MSPGFEVRSLFFMFLSGVRSSFLVFCRGLRPLSAQSQIARDHLSE